MISINIIISVLSGCSIDISSSKERKDSEITSIENAVYSDEKLREFLNNKNNNCTLIFNNTNFDKYSITLDDLQYCTAANIEVLDGENYEFLNYLNNVEKLIIVDKSNDQLNFIDGSIFNKTLDVSIYIDNSNAFFNEEKYGFLKNIKYINNLTIGREKHCEQIDFKFLEKLKNVHNLKLGVGLDSNIKYNDLSYLDSLTIDGQPYDIALQFSNEMIDNLEKSGVKVNIPNREEVVNTNNNIKQLAEELKLHSSKTDQEKLDIIIEYIINNFNYDIEVDSKELSNDEIGETYYSKDYLTAALEDEKQVCGNYASMVYILCREANIECYNLSNDIHSWNAVKVDDKFYYIDVTYIDSDYEKKYNNEYSFKLSEHYMMEPIYISDKIYNLNALPPGLEIKKIPPKVDYIYRNNDNKDLKKDIIKISNNGNSYYVHPINFLKNSAMFSLTFTITFKVLIIINKKLGIIKNNEKVKKKK